MTSFTVEWTDEAAEGLAEAWMNAQNPAAVNAASLAIDRRLARDPVGEGRQVSEGLYRLDEPPLIAHHRIELDTRTVWVLLVQ